jgi:hypothetical protein
MKSLLVVLFLSSLILEISSKSQDYARHIELSLLFYECQRSGPLPKTNRIYWRHDSMIDAGKDVGLDLTGGYYDAGDNVKFNFPQASALTLLAWSGIEFADGYKKAGQWDQYLDMLKWGTDFFIKCHPEKNVLYVQVGDGQIDHGHWYPPEYMDYEYPSFKIDAENPGSEVAAEMASTLAAASIVFKDVDSTYSETLKKHAVEIYDFADEYRGDYTKAVPGAQAYYQSFNGYNDELVWGAMWMYRLTGEEKYYEKFKVIADANYGDQDPKKYSGSTGPISWDDKRPGAYVLTALVTKEESRMREAYSYCDSIISQPKTAGGLWYSSLSQWASNRYAANAASMVALFASILEKDDPKRQKYIDFVKSQIDYILGDNPAGVNYVVGAEVNSPRAVHHRGASGTFDSLDKNAKPEYNIFTLYGALAGGPGRDDSYKDSRDNYQMNEVALDYNAGFQVCLAALVQFGLGVKDEGEILEFDRAWPPKPPTPDITVEVTDSLLSISTGSGMLCSAWCVSFDLETKVDNVYDATVLVKDPPHYQICNRRESNFLDGKGTPQVAKLQLDRNNFVAPTEFEVLCDGFHAKANNGQPHYIPEYGHLYKVTSPGGPENTKPLYEVTKCWPSHVC